MQDARPINKRNAQSANRLAVGQNSADRLTDASPLCPVTIEF
jgi:hypothetical protein